MTTPGRQWPHVFRRGRCVYCEDLDIRARRGEVCADAAEQGAWLSDPDDDFDDDPADASTAPRRPAEPASPTPLPSREHDYTPRTPEALALHRQICRDLAEDWHKHQQRPGSLLPR